MSVDIAITSSAVDAYTLTADRGVATAAAALAVIAAVIGTVALRRSAAPDGTRRSRRQSIVALVAGIASAATGGLILATADGGPGTGNGVVGGYAAVVVGLVATLLAGIALARSRRTA